MVNLSAKNSKQENFEFEAQQLAAWNPLSWPVAPDWQPLVRRFLDGHDGQRLGRFIGQRMAEGAVVYPPTPFRALALTPLGSVKVVILGQDPYHGAGQAHGLAFSVPPGVKTPPSLRNIFKELARSPGDGRGPNAGLGSAVNSLERWARQGVLLLNTCLTVEDGAPGSHAKQGWEVLTDEIIKAVSTQGQPVVFMLWGAHAQAKVPLLAGTEAAGQSAASRLVLTANHPSPLSALRPPQPFLGCGHFQAANEHLVRHGLAPIDWLGAA